MSNNLNGAGASFLTQLDFNSAIAKCSAVIKSGSYSVDDYICRAYAYCFSTEKDNANLDKAIADCSTVLSKIGKIPAAKGSARRIRAFAYYLKGDYASALRDCEKVLRGNADAEDTLFVRELYARIHLNLQEYEQAADDCRKSISKKQNIFHSFSLAQCYKDSCDKLQRDI